MLYHLFFNFYLLKQLLNQDVDRDTMMVSTLHLEIFHQSNIAQ